jgi:hypothetical protein
VYNSIVYYNGASNYAGFVTLENNCTTPVYPANFTNAPLFVDADSGDFRLRPDSPCINAGRNIHVSSGALDLDNQTRIVGGSVDVGAYEFQTPRSMISHAWLQRYGLPHDGTVDFADPDNDGLNNWQESRCFTDPTDPLSALRLLSISVTNAHVRGVTVSWQGVAGVSYLLERTTNLADPTSFTTVRGGIPGRDGPIVYPHGAPTSAFHHVYRVGVMD